MSLFYKSYSIFKPALALKIHGRNLKFLTTQLLSNCVLTIHSEIDFDLKDNSNLLKHIIITSSNLKNLDEYIINSIFILSCCSI